MRGKVEGTQLASHERRRRGKKPPRSVLQLCTNTGTWKLAQVVGGAEVCPELVLLMLGDVLCVTSWVFVFPPVLCVTPG